MIISILKEETAGEYRVPLVPEAVSRLTHNGCSVRVHGEVHYAVPNIPGTVARTAPQALSSERLPYIETIAANGLKKALSLRPEPERGLLTRV